MSIKSVLGKYYLGKKNGSPSGGYISVKYQPILKNNMGFVIAKDFPARLTDGLKKKI